MSSGFELAKKLGLNEYESKAYMSLLSSGSASASKVSSITSIPRARVYDVLVSLEKKGFVEKMPVKPVTYSAVLPTHAVKKIESTHRQNLDDSLRELTALALSLEKQSTINNSDKKEVGEVILISGWKNIHSKILQKLSGAKDEVVFSTTSKESLAKKKEVFSTDLEKLSKNGVKVKFKQSDARFVLFDKKSILLFLNQPSKEFENENALLLENDFVARFFTKK